jgi:hypothetical protein
LAIPIILANSEIGYIIIQVKNEVKPGNLTSVAERTNPAYEFYKGDTAAQYKARQNSFFGIVMSIGAEETPNRQIELVTVKFRKREDLDAQEFEQTNFVLHGLDVYSHLSLDVKNVLKKLTHCSRSNLDKMIEIYSPEVLENVAVGCADFESIRKKRKVAETIEGDGEIACCSSSKILKN